MTPINQTPITPAASQPETFINKVEVAQRLGKTLRTIDNWMGRGILPYYKIGRSVSFRWSEVEAHLAATCRVARRARSDAPYHGGDVSGERKLALTPALSPEEREKAAQQHRPFREESK